MKNYVCRLCGTPRSATHACCSVCGAPHVIAARKKTEVETGKTLKEVHHGAKKPEAGNERGLTS